MGVTVSAIDTRRFMNRIDPSSDSEGSPPRPNLLRHHQEKAEREAREVRETTVPPPVPAAGRAEPVHPSATSLTSALARANHKEEPSGRACPPQGESLDPNARSSLPLALARANESRKLPPKPIEDPEQTPASPDRESAFLTDFLFRFGSHSNRVHPLQGWGGFIVVYVVTVFLLGHRFALLSLPAHPGPLRMTASPGFWSGYLFRAFGIGVAITLLLSLLGTLLYRAGSGRPPFLWVFKVSVYAVAPVSLAGFYLLLELGNVGLEASVRGYRPDTWIYTAKILFSFAGVLSLFRLIQSASSQHCQASVRRLLLPGALLAFFWTGLVWGQPYLFGFAGRNRLEADLNRAEGMFHRMDPQCGPALEALGRDESAFWSHAQKVRLYRLRGESRFLEGQLSGAREDMIRLVRMVPPEHPVSAFGRAVNLLLLGQVGLARQHLSFAEGVTDGMENDLLRWQFRIRRGDFDKAASDPAEAESLIRQLHFLVPSTLHLDMTVDMMFRNDNFRRLLRELEEAERMEIGMSANSALLGAAAADAEGQYETAERLWRQALAKNAALEADERAAALRERFTSRP